MTDQTNLGAPTDFVQVVDLRTSDSSRLVATGIRSPRLSWRLAGRTERVRQTGYEIQVAADPQFSTDVHSSGYVETSSLVGRPWPAAPLTSRSVSFWRVRARTQHGLSEWSEPSRIEAGLLRREDWVARPIGDPSRRESVIAPVTLLRRSFRLDQDVVQARLYITALGMHETWINGVSVSDDLFEPGWTAYRSRLLYSVYDVTRLLRSGENVVASMVGEGWWARPPWGAEVRPYGRSTALLGQLELRLADRTWITVSTDNSWRVGAGAVRSASLFDGVDIDLRLEPGNWRLPNYDDASWKPASVVSLPEGLELRSMPPVRVVDRLSVKAVPTDRRTLLIDTGQNLTGYLALRARGREGATLTVRHAEVLNAKGELHLAPLRTAKATDRYTLHDDSLVLLTPSFTYHGFRYAEIDLDPGIELEEVTVSVIASDLRATGVFECSNTDINRLFENIRWSQRGNFIAIPTDCPQRDERLGWTGDIQVYADTACTNADSRAFLASWLSDLACDQRADGCVPNIVPDILHNSPWEYGAAGWGDAATVVPWVIYEHYGDLGLLERQFPSMRAWVNWCASRRGADGTWTGGQQFGDWLDPGAPAGEPQKARTDADYVASCYLALSARIVSRAATLLGEDALSNSYERLGREVAAGTWKRWAQHARSTQTGCAMAIQFEIAPDEERPLLGEELAHLVQSEGGRISTGFLGTPLLLPALANSGKSEAAYRLLLNEECPGWLYQVARGATTMWERWDAIKPDGSIHEGELQGFGTSSMLSFNHYAFGAVGAWLYRSLAGIAPVASDPAYGTIVFAPMPGGNITYARAAIDTPYGNASIDWSIHDRALIIQLAIPPGAVGYLVTPTDQNLHPDTNLVGLTPTPEPRPRLGYRLDSGRHLVKLRAADCLPSWPRHADT